MTLALVPKVPPLLDYIPMVSPTKRAPYHLADYVNIFERIKNGEPVRALVTYPIRHWKTWTTIHAILWLFEHNPTLNIVLLSYGEDRVKAIGKDTRQLFEMRDEMVASGKLRMPHGKLGAKRGFNEIHYWKNEHGGSILIMTPQQSREGFDCNVLICDDPIDEDGAKDPKVRALVDDKIARYDTRCQVPTPEGYKPGPVVIVMSRFNLYDPIELRMQRRDVEPWEVYHQPAIIHLNGVCKHIPQCEDQSERSFAPNVWPLAGLQYERVKIRRKDPNEREWWSRFQGDPQPDDPSSFGPPKRYPLLPAWPGFVDYMGVDMSYSKSSRADYAAVCVIRWSAGVCYVIALRQCRGTTKELAALLREMRAKYGDLPMFSYYSGPEAGALAYFNEIGLPIQGAHASQAKWIRAQPTIDAHNAGLILWPNETWVNDMMPQFRNFSGNESEHDDSVDALVSVYTLTRGGSSNVVPIAVGRRRM